MPARTPLLFAGLALAMLALPATARADVPAPDLEACGGKSSGDACSVGSQSGTCQPGTCSRLDYSQGTPPGSVQFDCVKCIPGDAPTPAAAPPADNKQTATSEPPKTSGGCSITGEHGGPALLLLLAFALRRRRV